VFFFGRLFPRFMIVSHLRRDRAGDAARTRLRARGR
jgi:hypothetical protein